MSKVRSFLCTIQPHLTDHYKGTDHEKLLLINSDQFQPIELEVEVLQQVERPVLQPFY